MNPNPIATIKMKDGAVIRIELEPSCAPNTVNSFIWLAGKHIFDHHAIERLAPGFVVDVSYTAYEKEEARYLIEYETKDASFPNTLAAVPGTVVMGGYENGIAGGEFFFPLKENGRLTWHYPAFGRIIEGLETVMSWNELPVKTVDFPLDPSVRITAPVDPLIMETVTVETFGVSYPEPVRIKDAVLPVNWSGCE